MQKTLWVVFGAGILALVVGVFLYRGNELSRLTANAKENQWGYGECYARFKELGTRVAQKSGSLDEVLKDMKDRHCSSGFLHGAAKGFVANADDPALAAASACDAYGAKGEWEVRHCVNGVGQGLFAALGKEDITPALQACLAYSGTLKQECTIGVYKEYFVANPENPWEFCDTQVEEYKPMCYALSVDTYLRQNPDADDELLSWCLTIDEPYRQACVFTAAHRITEYRPTDLTRAEQACANTVPAGMLPTCIEAAARGFAGFYGGPEKGKEACAAFLPEHRRHCPPNLRP